MCQICQQQGQLGRSPPSSERKAGWDADSRYQPSSHQLIIFANYWKQAQILCCHGSSENNLYCLTLMSWMRIKFGNVHLSQKVQKVISKEVLFVKSQRISLKHKQSHESKRIQGNPRESKEFKFKSKGIVTSLSSSIIIVLLKETRPLGTLNDPREPASSQTQSQAWLLQPT